MRGSIAALCATPHDVQADVLVFGADSPGGAFVSLHLRLGDDEIAVMLPAHAYHGARNVADAWGGLLDKKPLAIRRVPETSGIT